MKTASDFYVFPKWLEAGEWAFGRQGEPGAVPEEDKQAYGRIYNELADAVSRTREGHPNGDRLYVRKKDYSIERGARGHRPKDLWASLCMNGAEVMGHMPQVYVIASDRGLEVGFAASIDEDAYHDPRAKERNRSIVPFLNSKLPTPGDQLTVHLDGALAGQTGWHFNRKTRLIQGEDGFDQFSSLADSFSYLRQQRDTSGGGIVCRVYAPDELRNVDVASEFRLALDNFEPLLKRCSPTQWDIQIREAQAAVENAGTPEDLGPASEGEGRQKVWAEIARRQGQPAFRRKLLEAYDGKCAITETDVADTLQAAHIRPYNGPKTNDVRNGILLRADIHNLFDLWLLTIDPASMTVVMTPRLRDTHYWSFNGQKITLPRKPSEQPDRSLLAEHFSKALDK